MQIQELKASQAASAVSLRSSLLDPAVNLLIQHLRKELEKAKSALEETQNELSAWKFTPDRLLKFRKLLHLCLRAVGSINLGCDLNSQSVTAAAQLILNSDEHIQLHSCAACN